MTGNINVCFRVIMTIIRLIILEMSLKMYWKAPGNAPVMGFV